MQDYVINQLKESELRRKRGENKEIDLKEFIESRKNRIKELFPDINDTVDVTEILKPLYNYKAGEQ